MYSNPEIMEPTESADRKSAASALQLKDGGKTVAKSDVSEEEEMKWALHVLKSLDVVETPGKKKEESEVKKHGHTDDVKDSSNNQEEEMMAWALRTLERTKYLSDSEGEEEKEKEKEKQESAEPASCHKSKAVYSEVHCKEVRVVLARLTSKEIQKWTQRSVKRKKERKVKLSEKNCKRAASPSDKSVTLSNSPQVTSARIRVIPMEKLCYSPAACKVTPPLFNWDLSSNHLLQNLLKDSSKPPLQEKSEDLNRQQVVKRITNGTSASPAIVPLGAQRQQSRFSQFPFPEMNFLEGCMQLEQQYPPVRPYSSAPAMSYYDPYHCVPSYSKASAREVYYRKNSKQCQSISVNAALLPPFTKGPSFPVPNAPLDVLPDRSHHGGSTAVAAANPPHYVSVIKRVDSSLPVRESEPMTDPSCGGALNLTIRDTQPSSITTASCPRPTQVDSHAVSHSSTAAGDRLRDVLTTPRDPSVAVSVSLPNVYHSLKNPTVSGSSHFPQSQISTNSCFPEKAVASTHHSFSVSPENCSPGGNCYNSLYHTSNVSVPYPPTYAYGNAWSSAKATTSNSLHGFSSQKYCSYGPCQRPDVNALVANPYVKNPSFKSYANYPRFSAAAATAAVRSSCTFPQCYAYGGI